MSLMLNIYPKEPSGHSKSMSGQTLPIVVENFIGSNPRFFVDIKAIAMLVTSCLKFMHFRQ